MTDGIWYDGMEYLIAAAALLLIVLFIFVRGVLYERMEKARFRQALIDGFGNPPAKKYLPERFARIGGYHVRHKDGDCIDDITWNDLNMDNIFRRMDHTLSASGEEYLYHTLHNTGHDLRGLEHFEAVAEWFAEHEAERIEAQLLLKELGYAGKFSLYEYIDNLDYLGERSNRKHYIALCAFAALLALTPIWLPVGLLGIAVLAVYQIVSYFGEKNEIQPYIVSFAFCVRLMDVSGKLCRLPLPCIAGELESMRTHLKKLSGMRRGAGWLFSAGQSRITGNPLDLIMDYINMVFHVDLIVFNRMLSQLQDHTGDIDGLVTQAGFLDTAISTVCFRASLKNGWCVPRLSDGPGECRKLALNEAYHPLLDAPVKNSITAERGVLLTGSNASGKSTFLKTVAVNAILAQTIHTCTAESYSAPCWRIYSSMSLRDDLSGGESYYIVEIKAVKRILDAIGNAAERPVLCFVDEVLRGTNTVERIAASTWIMQGFSGKKAFCFAATHDIELTELLKQQYDNYHFEEEVRGGDIIFHYKLLAGKATTRNAIKLLEIMGFDEEIVDNAAEMARRFVENGIWQA